ncbi:MAG: phosphodiester glycosidase family protein [Nostocaceae cyanobacterium]|nr:phosphodiester glycosidase family protein [Nostocaceae cyanobacterium]
MSNQSNSYIKTLILPILATLLWLIPTSNANAQHSPSLKQPKTGLPKGVLSHGHQIFLNGRTLPGVWFQRQEKTGKISTYLSDGAVRQLIGVNLLNSNNPAKQPVQWFSSPQQPEILTSLLLGGYRYLEMTNFATKAGWQIQANDSTLAIVTPIGQVKNIRQTQTTVGETILVELEHPTPWQIRQELPTKKPKPKKLPLNKRDTLPSKPKSPPNRQWRITLDGIANPSIVQRYTPAPEPSPTLTLPNLLKQFLPLPFPIPAATPKPEPMIKQVDVVNNKTIITLSVPFGSAPLVSSLSNNSLQIEIRPDAFVEKDIAWAEGINWRQEFVNLGTDKFGVVSVEVNPRTSGLKLRPFVSASNSLVGTAPLIKTAQQQLALTAINGGFFNRNNRLPLGAIRRDGKWLSSPILNRGAIAWNYSGQFYVGRLRLEETLITQDNQKFPILYLNSGYVQAGISRYTPVWGQTYTPLTDNEIILTVQKNQITNQLPGGKAGETPIPIPRDGYLLTLRANAVNIAAKLPEETTVRITSTTTPVNFRYYPHILGAGPLLVQNRQIVLDAERENFSKAFIAQKAIRSAICSTSTGNLIIAAVHNRVGGAGPTLAEHAQLMQQMGCVNALNLDGGSSTGLYLGGQLLDRSPNTAARVHNGIGIFLRNRE